MNSVPEEKLKEVTDAALKNTHNALKFICQEFMKEGARPWELEICQEATPAGIRMYVKQVKRNKEGKLIE